jgi:hypothetical protein
MRDASIALDGQFDRGSCLTHVAREGSSSDSVGVWPYGAARHSGGVARSRAPSSTGSQVTTAPALPASSEKCCASTYRQAPLSTQGVWSTESEHSAGQTHHLEPGGGRHRDKRQTNVRPSNRPIGLKLADDRRRASHEHFAARRAPCRASLLAQHRSDDAAVGPQHGAQRVPGRERANTMERCASWTAEDLFVPGEHRVRRLLRAQQP